MERTFRYCIGSIFILPVLILCSCAEQKDKEASRAFGKGREETILQYTRGMELYHEGRTSEAFDVFESVIQADPSFIPAVFAAGKAAFINASYTEAESLFLQVLELEPRHIDTRKWLSRLLIISGRAAEAETYIKAALEISAEDPELLMLLGQAKQKSGDIEAALSLYRWAEALTERFAELSVCLAGLYTAHGLYAEARSELERTHPYITEGDPLFDEIRRLETTLEESR